ncbi:esterase-like activity of phytase family protein [Nocardia tengchongensis]|uniref:esterase-like activity of phytase family protein n=1 Tax=Nocardia tengchongensis TaxID=2055889 RepID=UPI00368AB732
MKFARLSIVACAVTVGITAPLLPPDSAASSRAESGLGIRYVNSVVVSDDTQFGGFKVGGLSGIDYDSAKRNYLAISDNRGEQGPVRAYGLRLPVDADGRLGDPEFDTLIQLRDADGSPYGPRTSDTESIRWTPNHKGFYYTSEGEAKVGRPGFIREATLDGSYVRDVPVPEAFTPVLDAQGALVSGIRDNLGFESMDLGRGNSAIVALSENALTQDGPAAGPDVESRARLVQIHHTTGADLAEYIYPVDKVAPGALPIATGVAEILSIDADRYLTLERSLIPGKGFTARIYETSTAGADAVTGQAAAPASAKPMSKRLLFDFAANGVDPQCTEGMTWGPDLPGGARSLVLVSDNNFGQAGKTAFHLLAVDNAR